MEDVEEKLKLKSSEGAIIEVRCCYECVVRVLTVGTLWGVVRILKRCDYAIINRPSISF